jgi:hypothetical protein
MQNGFYHKILHTSKCRKWIKNLIKNHNQKNCIQVRKTEWNSSVYMLTLRAQVPKKCRHFGPVVQCSVAKNHQHYAKNTQFMCEESTATPTLFVQKVQCSVAAHCF